MLSVSESLPDATTRVLTDPIWFAVPNNAVVPPSPPELVSVPAISTAPMAWLIPPALVMVISAVPAPTLTVFASVSPMLSTSFSPPAVKPEIVPIWLEPDVSDAVPAMPLLLVRMPAISVLPAASVTPPAEVDKSAVPPAPTEISPANIRALLSITAKVPMAVTAEIVPIWLAVPRSESAPAMLPVNVSAINVPVEPCVTPPADVPMFTVPAAPTLTLPASVRA